MNRFLLGGFAVLVLMELSLFWWQGRAEVEAAAPPPLPMATEPATLPSADAGDMVGPELPDATELSREQRRFGRYDRDRDGRISRAEMLSTRADGFRKLDKDGNNLLTFEEWAVATVDKFDGSDGDRDGFLTPAEFRKTAPPPKPRAKCSC
ncbi:hypothetical protein [Novosphingobium guangzhouense]|uniref:EF-hand domain-containing protein n=1 Tax=Novosphingobium guangzhouense TaxID=1850347 RepID=A0A2K2G1H0_9SPHN|nr:hypothetical protein [Novosphingobium guangzhouense]PNU04899.1 hypothetical protein A8V01_03370 [Novosphingobium guangzhouense]